MFKPSAATSVEEYIDMIAEPRRSDIVALHSLITASRPDLEVFFAYNMIGYGTFTYRNYKNEHVEWPLIALASQKQYISLYVCTVEDGEYIAEKYRSKLGKVSIGKSCIRFKKLSDINTDELIRLLAERDIRRNEMAWKQ